jgi:hypothetical protein
MKTYGFRKHDKRVFTAAEIAADPVLCAVAKRMNVTEGALSVSAKNSKSAYKKFFGVPYSAGNQPRMEFATLFDGYTGGGYAIVNQLRW